MGNYHYIVSSLVEYGFDADTKSLNTEAFCADIKEQLSGDDWKKLGELWWFFDLRNILDLRAGRSGVFSPLSNLTKEEVELVDRHYGASSSGVEEQEQEMPSLPSFVLDILSSYSGESMLSDVDSDKGDIDKQLWEAYYSYAASSKSAFVRAWSEFDVNVRNISAAFTARTKSISVGSVLVGDGEIANMIRQNEGAPDFALKNEFAEIDTLMQLLSEKDMLVKEKGLDKLRWQKIDSLVELDYFNIEYILGYIVKMSLLERWRLLDVERGESRLDGIVGSLTAKENIKSV